MLPLTYECQNGLWLGIIYNILALNSPVANERLIIRGPNNNLVYIIYLSDLVPRARVTLVGEPWGGLGVLAPVGHDPLENRVGQGLTRQKKKGRCNAEGNHFWSVILR